MRQGFLVDSYDPSIKPDASGFLIYGEGALQKGDRLGCLMILKGRVVHVGPYTTFNQNVDTYKK